MVNPQSFDWNQYPTNKTTQGIPHQEAEIPSEQVQSASVQQEQVPQNQEPEDTFNWGNFQTTTSYYNQQQEQQESNLGMLARNLVSNFARASETALGKYGDIVEFGKSVLENLPDYTGTLGRYFKEFVGPDRWKAMVRGEESLIPMQGFRPPASQDFRKATEALTGEYTKPKNKIEKGLQEFSSDVGATLSLPGLPGARIPEGRTPIRHALINNVGIPAAATAAKQSVEHLGFGEDKATWTKLAIWTALSLLGNVDGKKWATQQVDTARNSLPGYLTSDLNRYINRVDKLEKGFLHNDPRSTLAVKQVDGIRNDITNGRNSIQDLMTRYDAINAAKSDAGLFQIFGKARETAIKNIDQVRHAVRDQIMETGAAHPEALQQWRNGIQSLAVIHQSNRMTNWIQGVLKGPYQKIAAYPILGLFGLSGAAAYANPLATSGTAVASSALYKAGQIAYRTWNDPRLARYYWNAISAAQKENAPVFIKNIQELNRRYEQSEKKQQSLIRSVNNAKKPKSKKANPKQSS